MSERITWKKNTDKSRNTKLKMLIFENHKPKTLESCLDDLAQANLAEKIAQIKLSPYLFWVKDENEKQSYYNYFIIRREFYRIHSPQR